MTRNSALVISHTRRWVDDIVVGLNLCPFARGVTERLRYVVFEGDDISQLMLTLSDEMNRLTSTSADDLPTTLVITPQLLSDFMDYLAATRLVEQFIASEGLEGTIQLATMHPKYRFAGEAEDALSHFTNRSPYPIFHLLRESQVSQAVDAHPDTTRIPSDNIKRLEEMGKEEVLRVWREVLG